MIKWLAQSTIYRNSVDLLAVIDYGGEQDIGMPMQLLMTKHDRNQVVNEPTLALPPDSARSLMQALWDAGIRPSDWSNPNGEINALRNHVGFAEHVAKTLLAGPGQSDGVDHAYERSDLRQAHGDHARDRACHAAAAAELV